MDARHGAKHVVFSESESLVRGTSEEYPDDSQNAISLQQRALLHFDIDGDPIPKSSKTGFLRCSLLSSCCFFVFILVATILVASYLAVFKRTALCFPHEQGESNFSDHHQHFVQSASTSSAVHHLKELTKLPHVAGSVEDMATAAYVKQAFERYGLKTSSTDYEVLLSYPLERSLVVLYPNGSHVSLSLQEKPPNMDHNITFAEAIAPFHAYAPSGNATAEVVYVNYGRQEDYAKLEEMNVNVNGKIVIVRYGKVFRGDIVSIATKAGARAVIIYSDPQDFAGGGNSGFFPNSEWLPPSGVQRGTVFRGSGDPLTPGWPSTPNSERLSNREVAALLPKIPSLPISASDAFIIMSSLGGVVAPREWHGGLEIPEYTVGAGPLRLNLTYTEAQKLTRIRNVFGVVEGIDEPDRYVLLGNHRDAWTYGAVDPNSGTAALLEIARRLELLRKEGWNPRRTLLLCSWDAEEFGMIGSTEWVEQNSDLLAVRAIAYLNVDCAVAGSGFFAAATPQLDMLLKEVTREVQDPDAPDKSVYDTWAAAARGQPMITRLGGGGSDFIGFLQHVGVPSMDIYFGEDYPVYHSLYDTFQWLAIFGDPSFKRLSAAATIWGLAALHIADDRIIPFNYRNYGDELQKYTQEVEKRLVQHRDAMNVTVHPILSAITGFKGAIVTVENEVNVLYKTTEVYEKFSQVALRARILNDRLLLTERALLDCHGLPERPWHKHLVYGPSNSDEYGVSYFPGISWAISAAERNGEWTLVEHEIWKVARAIERAALVIAGKLA